MATKNKKKKPAKKSSSKKSSVKRSAAKKSAAKKPAKKKAAAKAARRRRNGGPNGRVETVTYEPKGIGARSGGQSGDLQGLSDAAGADAESVDELLEEGNAFEAEVVKGVEDVPDADEGEIRTREVPEDDVPEEYFGEEESGPSRRGKTAP